METIIPAIFVDPASSTVKRIGIVGDVDAFVERLLGIDALPFDDLGQRREITVTELDGDICLFSEGGDIGDWTPIVRHWRHLPTGQTFVERGVIVGCRSKGDFFGVPIGPEGEDIIKAIEFLPPEPVPVWAID